MIYTNEPANKFRVFLTAYRAHEGKAVNEKMTDALVRTIKTYPGAYGSLKAATHLRCFREKGQVIASEERTIGVLCHTAKQVAELTYLACKTYSQDAVLVVNTQTHTAYLSSITTEGEYPQQYDVLAPEVPLGTFQEVDYPEGKCFMIIGSTVWECK